jgi:hypothetical protein
MFLDDKIEQQKGYGLAAHVNLPNSSDEDNAK